MRDMKQTVLELRALVAYLGLAVTPLGVRSHTREALFDIGAAVLLLSVGIHQA
jgi:hypothetical protein